MEAAIGAIGLDQTRLARAVREGSREAWGVAYHQFGEKVYRLMLRMTGDPDLAADLTHDTFVQVAERGHQYSGRGSLAGWIFRIASNLAKERLRREAARRRLAEGALRDADRPRHTPAGDTELRVVLDAALATIPDEQRLVVLLYDVDGYTHSQIAEMLRIPVGTSKARLSRARAQLRTALRHAL